MSQKTKCLVAALLLFAILVAGAQASATSGAEESNQGSVFRRFLNTLNRWRNDYGKWCYGRHDCHGHGRGYNNYYNNYNRYNNNNYAYARAQASSYGYNSGATAFAAAGSGRGRKLLVSN
eukprot:jgi/Chrzof1/10799/Cz05g12150.t1